MTMGLMIGGAASAVGGAWALVAIRWAARRANTQALLGAFVSAFLLRIALVAGAIVAGRAVGANLLTTAGGFFAIYALAQIFEVLFVVTQSRGARRSEA